MLQDIIVKEGFQLYFIINKVSDHFYYLSAPLSP